MLPSKVHQAFIQALLSASVFSQRLSFFTVCQVDKFGSPNCWKMHFWRPVWLQRIRRSSLINTIFSVNIKYGLVLKRTKSYHPNRCIKVGNTPPRLSCWWVILIFVCNQTWQGQSAMFSLKLLLKKKTSAPFYGLGSTVSRLQSHYE